MSKFLINENLIQYFTQYLLLEQVIFEYILYPIYFFYCQQISFTLRVSSLLSLLNDTSVDIVDDEGSFQFSSKIEFTSPLQQTLKQNHRALHDCYNVKNMLKLLTFEWLLNELLLEIE